MGDKQGKVERMSLRTIGLLGGMTYHSTAEYYLGINNAVAAACGGHTSAPLLLSSVNFQQVRDFQTAGDWWASGQFLAHHAQLLQDAGAEAIVICTNLMHKVAPDIEAAIDVPLIHIVDAVAAMAAEKGCASVGLLGAGWTMRDPFYADRLATHDIATMPATRADIELTDRIVFDELTLGVIRDESRQQLLGVVDRLAAAGAQGVVLGCTEIPLILSQQDTVIPLIDSTKAHVQAAVRFVLGQSEPQV